LVPLLNNGDTH